MEKVKKVLELAGLLIAGLIIAVAQPVGLIAVGIVQVINLLTEKLAGEKLSRPVVTLVVFVVSAVSAILATPVTFPPFPAYAGDPSAFAALFYAWTQAAIIVVGPVVAVAMGTYNVILERLLKAIGDTIGVKLEPTSK